MNEGQQLVNEEKCDFAIKHQQSGRLWVKKLDKVDKSTQQPQDCSQDEVKKWKYEEME